MSDTKVPISGAGTVAAFINGRACSDTLFHMLSNRAFGHPLRAEELAAMPLAGGVMQHGFTCGMIWGAALAAGAEAYRRYGSGPRAEMAALVAAGRLVEVFRAQNRYVNCSDITELDDTSTGWDLTRYFLLQGGAVGCFRMAARYAPAAPAEVEAAFAEAERAVPGSPGSCTALLARRMGLSELHTVMVAGLAGGIGLSGGVCGALGAAIWIGGVRRLEGGAEKLDYKEREATATMARFVKATGGEFECARIAGQRFQGAADHARYLACGGCAPLLDALAVQADAG